MSINQVTLAECGVIYVATGQKYLNEAISSVVSLKAQMPEIPTALYTDAPDDVDDGFFTYKFLLESPIHTQGDKITAMNTPVFEKTIFLDSDTYVAESFEEVFQVLGKFDIAITHESGRLKNSVPECPECFCEFNSGVIGFVNNKKVHDIMRLWKTRYLEQLELTGNKSDQGVLRKTLYEKDVDLFVLTPEYNYRTKFPGFLGRGLNAKILHGRDVDMRFFAKSVNNIDAKRVVIPSILLPTRCAVVMPIKGMSKIVSFFNELSCKGYRLKKVYVSRWKRRFNRLKNFLRF